MAGQRAAVMVAISVVPVAVVGSRNKTRYNHACMQTITIIVITTISIIIIIIII